LKERKTPQVVDPKAKKESKKGMNCDEIFIKNIIIKYFSLNFTESIF
jgi:hypothetical protein